MTECTIAKLADEDLAAIFKRLPPFERLIVSEASRKWQDFCQKPWRDIVHLDLSKVPTVNIHAVIKKCPNLISVSALRQNLGDFDRFASRLSNIASLRCVECTLDVGASFRPASSWNELIWHNSKTVFLDSGVPRREYPLPYAKPSTLFRLQVSGVSMAIGNVVANDVYDVLNGLLLLECCIMADVGNPCPLYRSVSGWACDTICPSIVMPASLRELYLDWTYASSLTLLVSKLTQLKMLYLNNVDFQWTNVKGLLTQHASLCVVVITASRASDFNGEVLVPARKLFPNGFNAPPVPPLHLFLGKIAAQKLRFHPSPSEGLKIYPIDAPLPEFLEKEEIKPIFEGSWIATRIKEGAKEGVNVADYSFEGNAESILYAQES